VTPGGEPEPFRPIEPYDTGMLDVGDGQSIYWEVSGNPEGKPAVALHGGPGSGSTPGRRRWFDPERYRIVQFDQRGCGRSTPHAGDPSTDLATNTTHHLVADIERLREHLGIERWLVWGGSWGVTLALAYAERHPERVSEMVLLSITLTRRADVHWLAHETGRFFPEEWARFRAGVPATERDGDLVAAYDRLLNGDARPDVRVQAARDWVAWEDAILSLEEGYVTPNPRWADERFMVGFARLVTHYFSHAAWLEEDELLREAHRLTGIPGVLLHGRLDLSGPPDVAWQLAQAWPGAELRYIPGGHTGDAEMDRSLLEATNRFATNEPGSASAASWQIRA
jgi:proline iminopeptidase